MQGKWSVAEVAEHLGGLVVLGVIDPVRAADMLIVYCEKFKQLIEPSGRDAEAKA